MQIFLILAVVIVPIFGSDTEQESCAKDVFCGSMEDIGYCSNPAHCNQQKLWYHDAASGKCVPFSYYGSGGNYNRFYSREQCEKTCIGYSHKYKKVCQKCPNPVHVDIGFNFDTFVENGFFCNGDDCNCPSGEKCCPVLYSVTISYAATRTEQLNGYKCLPAVVGECDKPYEGCSKRKRRQRHSHRKYKG